MRQAKEWPPEVIALIQVVGECFANALERRQTDRALRDRKVRLQAALREAEEARDKIDAIVRSLKAGVIATDREGRIALMNRAAETILGQPAGSLLGHPAAEAIPVAALREQIVATVRGTANLAPAEWESGTTPERASSRHRLTAWVVTRGSPAQSPCSTTSPANGRSTG